MKMILSSLLVMVIMWFAIQLTPRTAHIYLQALEGFVFLAGLLVLIVSLFVGIWA